MQESTVKIAVKSRGKKKSKFKDVWSRMSKNVGAVIGLIIIIIFSISAIFAEQISPEILLMCDKEAIEVQKILPFLSDTWPLCRIGRAVIRASQSCRQSCNKSQCPACGCRSHHSCTHAPQFSRSFPAREWGSVLQRQGACGQCP